MSYRVAEKYIAERRGGPLRAGVMSAAVFLCISALAYSQRGSSIIGTLIATGVMLAIAAAIAIHRMTRATYAMERLSVDVTPNGLDVQSIAGPVAIPADSIRSITMFRTMLPPKVAYFVLSGARGTAVIPPIEDADAFASEVRRMLPTIPFTTSRKLFAIFGA